MFAMKWFIGLSKRPKIIMSALIVPLVLLLVILILERLFKALWFLGDKVSNAISHIFNKENRVAYILVSILMLLIGGYLEYSNDFFTHIIDSLQYVINEYNYIIDYIKF